MYCLVGWVGLVWFWDFCKWLFEGIIGCDGVVLYWIFLEDFGGYVNGWYGRDWFEIFFCNFWFIGISLLDVVVVFGFCVRGSEFFCGCIFVVIIFVGKIELCGSNGEFFCFFVLVIIFFWDNFFGYWIEVGEFDCCCNCFCLDVFFFVFNWVVKKKN